MTNNVIFYTENYKLLKILFNFCVFYYVLSTLVCGYLYFRDNNATPEKLLGTRTFYSPNGEINFKLFIDKSSAEEMTQPLWNTVQIIFTSVKGT